MSEGFTLWTTSAGGGSTIPAGLPNITGGENGTNYPAVWSGAQTATGAFRCGNIQSGFTNAYSGWGFMTNLFFNADAGAVVKGIYRNDCKTVQPPAYKVIIWRRTN